MGGSRTSPTSLLHAVGTVPLEDRARPVRRRRARGTAVRRRGPAARRRGFPILSPSRLPRRSPTKCFGRAPIDCTWKAPGEHRSATVPGTLIVRVVQNDQGVSLPAGSGGRRPQARPAWGERRTDYVDRHGPLHRGELPARSRVDRRAHCTRCTITSSRRSTTTWSPKTPSRSGNSDVTQPLQPRSRESITRRDVRPPASSRRRFREGRVARGAVAGAFGKHRRRVARLRARLVPAACRFELVHRRLQVRRTCVAPERRGQLSRDRRSPGHRTDAGAPGGAVAQQGPARRDSARDAPNPVRLGCAEENPTQRTPGGWTRCCASSRKHLFLRRARSMRGSSHDPWRSTHPRSSSCSARNRWTKIGSSAPSSGPGHSPIRRPGDERRARSVCEPSASKSSAASSEDDSSPRTWLSENGPSGRARPPERRRRG